MYDNMRQHTLASFIRLVSNRGLSPFCPLTGASAFASLTRIRVMAAQSLAIAHAKLHQSNSRLNAPGGTCTR